MALRREACFDPVTASWPEWLALAFCCVLVVVIGVVPGIFINFTQAASKMLGI